MGRASRAKRKRREARAQPSAPKQAPAKLSRRKLALQLSLLAIVVGLAGFVVAMSGSGSDDSGFTRSANSSASPSFGAATIQPRDKQYSIQPDLFHELVSLDPDKLDNVSLGRMNLLAAKGLPGSENLDIQRCLATLDRWAERVKSETARHLYKFQQNPGNYRNSEAYFRMLMLVTVLQQDLGVHYNKARMRKIDFTRSQDLFIHGMLPREGQSVSETNGGTCISMPVIYTAVARRLGYPVKLVTAKAHVFCRWDGPHEQVNVEATNRGMNSFEDEYYTTWPKKASQAEIEANGYLESLSPQRELALCLVTRGHNVLDRHQPKRARKIYAKASGLAPDVRLYDKFLADARQKANPSQSVNAMLAQQRRARRTGNGPAGTPNPSAGRDPLHSVYSTPGQPSPRMGQQRRHPNSPSQPDAGQWNQQQPGVYGNNPNQRHPGGNPGRYGQPQRSGRQPGIRSNSGFQSSPDQPMSPNRRGRP